MGQLREGQVAECIIILISVGHRLKQQLANVHTHMQTTYDIIILWKVLSSPKNAEVGS